MSETNFTKILSCDSAEQLDLLLRSFLEQDLKLEIAFANQIKSNWSTTISSLSEV